MNCLKRIPKPIHSLSLLLVLILSSCKNNNDLDLNIICPMGAPAITLVDYARNGNVEITNTASNVKSAFAAETYDIIIFDAINGLKLIKTQNAKYRLARILTNGNLFLVSTGNDKDDNLSSDDYIVSFGENLIPDLIFKSVYKDIKISHYYPSAAIAQSGLCSGYHEGQEIDYAILSEPFIHNAINNASCKNKNIKVMANIAQEFSSNNEEKNYRGFPQAGLFISHKLEDDPSKEDTINTFLSVIDSRTLDLANNSASDTVAFLNKKYSTDQTNQLFGFSASTLEELQKNKENKLSYNYQQFDIIKFSKDLKLIDIEENHLSSYYKK